MDITSLLARSIKKIYPRFGLRSSDVILSSYPKSGNTWLRFIWANVISIQEIGGREVDFHFLNNELVAEYDSHSYGNLEYDSVPRFVKTHRAYDRRFRKNKSLYIVRHPGDTMLSFYEWKKAQKHFEDNLDFSEFIRDDRFGIPSWCKHVKGWQGEATVTVTYGELKTDCVAAVSNAFQKLGIEVADAVLKEAVRRSSFENMREVEEKKGRPGLEEGRFDDHYNFTNKGRRGEWRKKFSSEDVEYMEKMIDKNGINFSI